ncbi:DUF3791 domain-containing protein [Fibrobacter sp. UWH9]
MHVISYLNAHYGILHTQSMKDAVDSLTEFCKNHSGTIVCQRERV